MLQQLQSAVAGEWLLSGGTVTCKILMPMTVRRSVEARRGASVATTIVLRHAPAAANPGRAGYLVSVAACSVFREPDICT